MIVPRKPTWNLKIDPCGKEHHLPYLPNLHFRNCMLVFGSLWMLWFSKWVDTTHTSRVFWCYIPPHQKKKEGNFRKRPVFFGKRTLLCSTKKSKTTWTSHLEDHQTPPSAPPPKVSWTIRMWIRFGGMKRGCLSWKKCARYCCWFRNPKKKHPTCMKPC